MSRRRWVWAVPGLLGLIVVLGGLVALFDPAARVQGWAGGEPFFRGRSATAWRRELRKPDEVEAAAATAALAGGAGEAVPVCTWLVRRVPEPQVRARAVNALARMGKDAGAAGPDLVAALADGDPLVRSAAARLIGDLAPDVPGAVPALVGLFPDREAMRAAGEFKEAAAPAVPKLAELLKHPDPAVRRQAVRALGRVGTPAHAALGAIVPLVTGDPEPGVREFAAAVLGEWGPVAAAGVPALAHALRDADTRVRLEAVRSLGRMGPAARDVLPDVQAVKDDPDPGARKAAADAARKIDPGPE